MSPQSQSLVRRSSRLSKIGKIPDTQAQTRFHSYLAFGRFANQNWAVWPADLQTSSPSLRKSPKVSQSRSLYVDNDGYFAIRSGQGSIQWLPIRVGPRNTCNHRDIPLSIPEGRLKITFDDHSTLIPTIAIIAGRVFFHEKMWYLVTYNLLASLFAQSLDFTHRYGNQIQAVLQTDRTLLQCAPSWIAVDDFKPEEFHHLQSFYARTETGTLEADKVRCASLAAIMGLTEGESTTLAEGQSSPMISPSL